MRARKLAFLHFGALATAIESSVSHYLDSFPHRLYTHQAMSTEHASLNLASLLNQTAGSYEVSDQGQLSPEAEVLARVDLRLAEPLDWSLTVRSTGGDDDFILEGKTKGLALMECRRCLDEVEVEVNSSFVYPMIYRPGTAELTLIENDDEIEDTLVFGKPEVDFSGLIAQVTAIDAPLTVLCQEECRGLSSDGVNLNEHPEQADPSETEKPSPFAVLKDFEV